MVVAIMVSMVAFLDSNVGGHRGHPGDADHRARDPSAGCCLPCAWLAGADQFRVRPRRPTRSDRVLDCLECHRLCDGTAAGGLAFDFLSWRWIYVLSAIPMVIGGLNITLTARGDVATGIAESVDILVAAAQKSPRGQGRSVVTQMTSHGTKRSHTWHR
jgi:hypothetical protein